MMPEAKDILESLNETDVYNENEQDVKLLVKSLLGLLKKNFGKSHEENIEGIRLLDQAKDLSKDVNLHYERCRWL